MMMMLCLTTFNLQLIQCFISRQIQPAPDYRAQVVSYFVRKVTHVYVVLLLIYPRHQHSV